jgi:hypothetical protein
MPGAMRLRLAGLLLWLVLPVLATTRHSLPLQPHYFLVLVPVPALLVGMLCQWLLARRARLWLGVVLAGLAAVLLVQVLTVARLLGFVATQYEPCYGAPVRLTQDIARQAVVLGSTGGATRASIENEDGDADSIAYLVRGAMPNVDLAGVGAIGIGARAALPAPATGAQSTSTAPTTGAQAASTAPATSGSVLDAVQPVGLSFEPGVQAGSASVSDDPLQGGRVRVGLTWQVDASSTWSRPVVWQVTLTNAQGQVVQRASGIDHVPAAMAGEHVLSWFTLDTPREIGPGPYQTHLRLIDADRGQPIGDEWSSAGLAIRQTARCRG